MAAISSLQIAGTIYDINAKSALSAGSATSASVLTNTTIKVSSATSASKAVSASGANSATYAVQANIVTMSEWTANSARPITFSHPSSNADSLGYDSVFTFNPSSNVLSVPYVSATTVSANLSGSATSALTSKSALSAGSAKSAVSAGSATSALSAATATKIQMTNATENKWFNIPLLSSYSIYYDSDTKINYNPSSNTLSSINIYGTTVSGATISGTSIKATTFSGNSSSIAVDTLIGSATRPIGSGVITITTASSPSTSQTFNVNQNSNSSIELGTMAFKASGDFLPNSYSSSTASTFAGSAKSAEKATSASKAASATSALSAGTAQYTNFSNYYLDTGSFTYPPTFDSATTYTSGTVICTSNSCFSANTDTTTGEWADVSSQFSLLTTATWTATNAAIPNLYTRFNY